MKLIKGQISLFDDANDIEVEIDEERFSISEFDRMFGKGSRFLNRKSIVEITDLLPGEINAEIRNVTLEQKGWYVGARYYLNKESYGKWYLGIAENGNVMPCPYRDKCGTHNIGCYGMSYWCGKYGKEVAI